MTHYPSLQGETWTYSGTVVHGLSLSGIRTCLSLPQLGVAFDVAQGLPFALNMKKYFISHGHLDHAAGIPYIISHKAMISAPKPPFYMPKSLVEPLTSIVKMWEQIEGHQYEYDFYGVDETSRIELNKSFFVKPFRTSHRIDSFGYALVEHKKKLKANYVGMKKEELVKLKSSGITIDAHSEEVIFAFTGDTRIDFLDMNSWLKQAKILCLEATYLDNERSVEHARQWGHTHLDEILDRLDDLQCERLVLIHVSSRYSYREALKILSARVPVRYQERVVLFPGQ